MVAGARGQLGQAFGRVPVAMRGPGRASRDSSAAASSSPSGPARSWWALPVLFLYGLPALVRLCATVVTVVVAALLTTRRALCGVASRDRAVVLRSLAEVAHALRGCGPGDGGRRRRAANY